MNKEKNYISCEAENCVYHKGRDTCTAEKIRVAEANACTSDETKCRSFKMQEEKPSNYVMPT